MKTVIIAKAVLLNQTGQILAMRRSKTAPRRPLQWDLPGGFVEEGEELVEGMAREIKEEAGFDVDPAKLQLIYAKTAADKRGNVVWLFYVGKVGAPTVALSYEHDKSKWMDLGEAIKEYDYQLHQNLFKYIQQNQLLPK